MAEMSKKRPRKSKIVLRDCDDEMQEPSPKEPITKPKLHFDVRVEVESCADDTDMPTDEIRVKTEPTEIDLFEAEEDDINKLALSLTRKSSQLVREKNKAVVETVEKANVEADDNFEDEENYINKLASTLTSKVKRKRFPNTKMEYVYSDKDSGKGERDVDALEKILGGKKQKKDKKTTVKSNLDINRKMEMWKTLNVESDEDSCKDSDSDGLVIDELPSKNINTKAVRENKDGRSNQNSSPSWENKYDLDENSVIKPINLLNVNLKQLKMEDELIMERIEELSKTLTEPVDKILEIEARNLWGRVRYTPHLENAQQLKLTKALANWRNWCRNSKYKDPPLMYKCYVCEKAWWHLQLFKEHLNEHKYEEHLKVEIEYCATECCIIAKIFNVVPKYFAMEDNCWQCGKDVNFHQEAFNKLLKKGYGCDNCYVSYGSCRLLREHEGDCPRTLMKVLNTSDVKNVELNACTICPYKVMSREVLEKHMETYHDVRSDVPVPGPIIFCPTCSQPVARGYWHVCPKRNHYNDCTFCGKRYPTKLSADTHMSLTPSDVECRVCGEKLPKKCMETKHMAAHSSSFTLMYKCTGCPDSVLMQDVHCLKHHRVTVHNQKYEKRKINYDMVLVPTALVDEENPNGTSSVKASNTKSRIDKQSQTQKSKTDNQTEREEDVMILNNRQVRQVIELDGNDEGNIQTENVTRDENTDQSAKKLNDDELENQSEEDYVATITIKEEKLSEDEADEMEICKMLANSKNVPSGPGSDVGGYEDMLSQVFHSGPGTVSGDHGRPDTTMNNEVDPLEDDANEEDTFQPKPKKNKKSPVYQCSKCTFTGTPVQINVHMEKHRRQSYEKQDKIYVCSKCNLTFSKIKYYSSHLVSHGYEPKSCPECMATFSSYLLLEKHIFTRANMLLVRMQFFMRKPNKRKPKLIIKHQCRKCKKDVNLRDAISHWESHIDLRELASIVPDIEIKVEMTESPETYTVFDHTYAGGVAEGGSVAVKLEREDDDGVGTAPLEPVMQKRIIAALLMKHGNKECMMCERVFDRRNDAKRHLIEHLLSDAYLNKYQYQGLRCQICFDIFQRADVYKLHMRSHGGLPVYRCNLCGKTFSDSSNFTKHKKVHDIEVLTCYVCAKKFLAKTTFERHMQTHASQSGPLQCPNCHVVCHSEAIFHKHMKVAHDTRPKYRCIICKRRFQTLKERWNHSWLQHGERKHPADCPVCGQAYRKLTDLRTHAREIHNIQRDMLHEILATVRVETTKSYGGVKCPNCPLNFPDYSALMLHMRSQHQSLAHKCPTCAAKFNTRSALMRHRSNGCRVVTVADGE